MTIESFDTRYIKNLKFIKGFLIKKSEDLLLAEDLSQELYIRGRIAIEKGKYTEQGKFRGWLTWLAHNLLIDHWRKENQQTNFINMADFDIWNYLTTGENCETKIIEKETVKRVVQLVDHLPASQKKVYKMHVIKGMRFIDISTTTQIKLNTVLSSMRYARIKLKRAI